jgi:hypothetical protein
MQVTVATKMQHFNELNNFLFHIFLQTCRSYGAGVLRWDMPIYRYSAPQAGVLRWAMPSTDIVLLRSWGASLGHAFYRHCAPPELSLLQRSTMSVAAPLPPPPPSSIRSAMSSSGAKRL